MMNSISTNQEFRQGDEIDSSNKLFKAILQNDGNFVVKMKKWETIWHAGTAGCGSRVVLQDDGNLVVYNKDDQQRWSTRTGEPGADFHRMRLTMTDGGELQLSNNGKTTWKSPGPRAPDSPGSSASDDNPGDKLQENVYTKQ